MLRRGNHASAEFWRRALLPVIERYRHLSIPKFFRSDSGGRAWKPKVTQVARRRSRLSPIKWEKLSLRKASIQ